MTRFILTLIVSLLPILAEGKSFYFRHYRNDNGLSNNTVMACIQDRRGFIWFGTKEGLNRFDGSQFRIFLHSPSDKNCIINNFVTSLCEDADGWIWVGTAKGICYYSPDNDYFGSINEEINLTGDMIPDIKADNNGYIWFINSSGIFKYKKENKKLIAYPAVEYFTPISITVTHGGDIWFTATDGKIYKYDPSNDDFVSYKILNDKELTASVRLVDILDDGNNGLIISTNLAGLRRLEPNTGNITTLFENDLLWNNIHITTTFLNNNEEIWIGSESGIYIYNFTTGYLKNFHKVPTDPFSISNNAIRIIMKDKERGIWIGTQYGGANYLPNEAKLFEKYYPTGLPGALNANVVREIRADSYGTIWIGTEDAGLIKYDPGSGLFSNLTEGPDRVDIDSRNIQGLLVDDDDLWIGTYDNGIYILDIPSQKIKNHFEFTDQKSGLRTNSFITFLKTTDGFIYAGSVMGLYRYIPESLSFKYLDNVAAGAFIHALFEDKNKNMWIGTYGKGLFKYDKLSEISEKILSKNGNYETIRSEYITSIFEDKNYRIWFTTEGNGFSYIDKSTGEIISFVPGKDIDFAIYCAILQDSKGDLWITSTRGLLRFDPSTDKFVTFTKADGLLDNSFSYNSAYQDKNGKIYFGTVSGLVSFHPDNIGDNIYNPPVYFVSLQVNGREYFINDTGSEDYKSILVENKISLKHHQSWLSIDFISPTFTSPDLTKYKYFMEGSDPDWIMLSGHRKVYYTNLNPGDYRFRVLSSSDGNSWNTGESVLDIRIRPPVWLSFPAYIFYIFLSAFSIYILISYYMKRNVLEQQRKIDLLEAEKEKELLNAKIDFFTNITHEIRTPLTLIKGPIDKIIKLGIKDTKDTEDNIMIIKRNSDRLLNLTNQLLDFRKTEKEMFKLNFKKTNIYELIESIYHLFLPYCTEKSISIHLHSPVNHYNLAVDREAITKILSNLLSNALKFAESEIDISFEPETENNNIIRIRVKSDGIQIPKELKEKIFEPFYQIDFNKPGEKGTGLGLSLARSLAELHHGRLVLDPDENIFNSFILELGKNQEELVFDKIETDEVSLREQQEFEIFGSLQNSHPNILLVEDEIEMGRFIANEITGDYNVILARNGQEALKALEKFHIILVVSDVIMPVINGYELCIQIKSNIEYSHIPVILLTAIVHLTARIQSLDSGADAYIEKPFSTDLLMAQIENLIKNRSLYRQNFISSPLAHIKSVALNNTDEEFLEKLNSIIMDNISENDLNVETIAVLMGLSISTLYRKVKALTDLNTVEYIRLVRLKKAAELLCENNYRINEISYLVGFSSPSYFATSFQKQFGLSPSQFVRKNI